MEKTDNIPLAAAGLTQAVARLESAQTTILPQSLATYLGGGALFRGHCRAQA